MTGRSEAAARAGRETWRRVRDTDALLVGAGVAFFALLSFVPTLAALVALYGLFADPSDVAEQVSDLYGADGGPGRQWVVAQLVRLTSSNPDSLRLAAIVGVVVALWSASSGVRHLLDAVDAALGRPRASLVRSRLRAFLGVFVLVSLAAVGVAVLAAAPAAGSWLSWLRYPVLALLAFAGCVGLYRSAGSGRAASAGALVAVAMWAVGSVAVAGYVAWSDDLESTYGAFASVVVVMLWLWSSAVAVVVGAHVTAVASARRTGLDG